MVKHKIALISLIVGLYFIKFQTENWLTNLLGDKAYLWFWIGLIIIIISAHYLGKTQFSFKTIWSWFKK